ncbi:MAG: serine hydrolase domain-containing protein [Melioribacteraceae bacterium]
MRYYKKNLTIFILFLCLFLSSCDVDSPVATTQNKILTSETISKLQTAADKMMKIYQTPGLVAFIFVEGEGGLLIKRGVSNTITNEPVNENNYFRIGSITKTFTTEAVLILVDEGLIDLDKQISFYLPTYNIPSGNIITVRMLANMSSGLFNYTYDDKFMYSIIASNGQKVFTPDSMLAASFRHPLTFEPGTKYDYCNTNTILLGLLITKVTGKTVSQVFEEKIFTPLGMTKTYWPISRYLSSPYSHGYFSGAGQLTDVTYWNPSQGDAAGILISKISDLIIWSKEIHERTLLSEKGKIERYKWNTFDPTSKNAYGFGLMKMGNWIGHDGTVLGYNTCCFYNETLKTTIILSANSNDDNPAESAFNEFTSILEMN